MNDNRITFSLGAVVVLLLCALIIGPGSRYEVQTAPHHPSGSRLLRSDYEQTIQRFPEPEQQITAPGNTPLDEVKQGLLQRMRAARQPSHSVATQVCVPSSVAVQTQTTQSQVYLTASEPTLTPPLHVDMRSQGVTGTPCLPCDQQVNRTTPAFVPHQYSLPPYVAPNSYQPLVGDVFTRPTSAKYRLALFVDQSMKSSMVLNWFNSNEQLARLKRASEYQVYSPRDTLYITRHQAAFPVSTFPCVVLMDQTGGVIYQGGGRDLPLDAGTLWADMCKGKENYDSIQSGRIARYLTQQQHLNAPTISPISATYDPLPRYSPSDFENQPCPPGTDCNRPPLRPSPDPDLVAPIDVWPAGGPATRILTLNFETLIALAVIAGCVGLAVLHIRNQKTP